jgi:2-methylcitrate dehydratase PrpD
MDMNAQLTNPEMVHATGDESRTLAAFASTLQLEDIPDEVVERFNDLFVDWIGSTLSGKGQRAIVALERFVARMGPASGNSEILTTRQTTSPLFAAMVNAAASHISEQDDVHNASVFHPAAVVFPAAMAIAQDTGASGRDFVAGCVAGYETGIRIGEFLGRSHYKIFHTTGTAGTIAAAVAVGRVLRLDETAMLNAIGSAGTQAAGLWEFLRDAADSKQLHTAKAASDGLTAACLAADGFTGARHILEGAQGMAAGMSEDADPRRLIDRLGSRWALAETSFKWHSSCRHTHPAADALLHVIEQHGLRAEDLERIVAHVHQGALDVLGPVTAPRTVHQAKFSMPATLGLIATHRRAGMEEFDGFFNDDTAKSFLERVKMHLDREVDGAYPVRWIGKVTVHTKDGREYSGRVDEPKGDPGNPLTQPEVNEKARRLAGYSNAANPEEMDAIIEKARAIAGSKTIPRFVPVPVR